MPSLSCNVKLGQVVWVLLEESQQGVGLDQLLVAAALTALPVGQSVLPVAHTVNLVQQPVRLGQWLVAALKAQPGKLTGQLAGLLGNGWVEDQVEWVEDQVGLAARPPVCWGKTVPVVSLPGSLARQIERPGALLRLVGLVAHRV
jgi:hypothetical protein